MSFDGGLKDGKKTQPGEIDHLLHSRQVLDQKVVPHPEESR